MDSLYHNDPARCLALKVTIRRKDQPQDISVPSYMVYWSARPYGVRKVTVIYVKSGTP